MEITNKTIPCVVARTSQGTSPVLHGPFKSWEEAFRWEQKDSAVQDEFVSYRIEFVHPV